MRGYLENPVLAEAKPDNFEGLQNVAIQDQQNRYGLLAEKMKGASDLIKEAAKYPLGSPQSNMLLHKSDQYNNGIQNVYDASGDVSGYTGNPNVSSYINPQFQKVNMLNEALKNIQAYKQTLPEKDAFGKELVWNKKVNYANSAKADFIKHQQNVNETQALIAQARAAGDNDTANKLEKHPNYLNSQKFVNNYFDNQQSLIQMPDENFNAITSAFVIRPGNPAYGRMNYQTSPYIAQRASDLLQQTPLNFLGNYNPPPVNDKEQTYD
jgi:hypothetical protein